MQAYPLQWPQGLPRQHHPKEARFKTTFGKARDQLIKEIGRMKGTNVVLSTNVPLKADGLPYARYATLEDTGVAVYFTYKKKQVALACDEWKLIQDNIQALFLTIQAIRNMERWGVSDILDRTFSGFKALPQQASESNDAWYQVLNISYNSSKEVIQATYKALAKECHPDGSKPDAERFLKIKKAYEEGMAEMIG